MKMDKILTLVIPSYNMEAYLPYCLDSLLVKANLGCLEVLVVNDGSRDRTSEIAHAYEKSWPDVLRVIDKENGNYGSCVNRGLKEARGKYIKILDADDSFDTANFEKYLAFLQMTDADLVISDFAVVDENRNITRMVTHGFPAGYLQMDDICNSQNFSHIQMHAVTYRRDLLLNLAYEQTEGISYTDQEWTFTPMAGVKTVCCFDKYVYKYLVGREGQTMNPSVKVKRIHDVCRCVYSMGRAYEQYKDRVSEQVRKYFHGRLYYMIKEVYVSCFLNYSAENKRILRLFDSALKGISQEAYDLVGGGRFNYIAFWRVHPDVNIVLVKGMSWCYCRAFVPLKRCLSCHN